MTLGSKVLFTAYDRLGGPPGHSLQLGALWITDGTSAGTSEIGGDYQAGIKGIGGDIVNPAIHFQCYGLQAGNLVAFGKHAAFFGNDADGRRGIWVTDGTAAGTNEIGGSGSLGIKDAYFGGIQATDLTALGNRLIFQGVDKYNHTGLWVTDGTTHGTKEVGGVRNADILGASSDDFDLQGAVTVGSHVFFQARDSSNSRGLWVTDGTAKGTVELGEVGGTPLATLGNKMLFGSSELWVSDGTVKGTAQLLSSAPVKLADMDGALWFTTRVTNYQTWESHEELWTTDGTKHGTHRLLADNDTAIIDAGTDGLRIDGDGARVGDRMVFNGEDASGQRTLWVTDGTAKGTVEVGGLNNAGVKGVDLGGLHPVTFVSSGDRAYFTSGVSTWVTDGTAKGTVRLDGRVRSGDDLFATDITVLPSSIAVSGDATVRATATGLSLSGDIVDDLAVRSVLLFDGSRQMATGRISHDHWTMSVTRTAGIFDHLKIVAKDADGRADVAYPPFDWLVGTDHANSLKGSARPDILEGLTEADILTGGKGADVFAFISLADSKATPAGRDRILDFSHAQHDQIDLRLIDANADRAGNQRFHFIGNHAFDGKAGELDAVALGGKTLVRADVDGDRTADFSLLLGGHHDLHANDFLL